MAMMKRAQVESRNKAKTAEEREKMEESAAKNAMQRAYEYAAKAEEFFRASEEEKANAWAYAEKNDISSLELGEFSLKKTKRSIMKYDSEALKPRLSKAAWAACLSRRVEIADQKGFSAFMKKKGIPFSEVEQFLNVIEKADAAKVNALFEMGLITAEQLQGTFELVESETLNLKPIEPEQ